METAVYLRFIMSLLLVLGLILGLLWAVRRFGFGGLAAMRPSGRRRLTVVESLTLDARRRLVLVRRDGREHLLLVGGESDLLIEGGIDAAQPSSSFELAVAKELAP